MDLYATPLFLALAATLVGAVAALSVLLRRRGSGALGRWLVRTMAPSAVLSLALLTLSLVVHLNRDHGPRSDEPLAPVEFVTSHPVYLVLGALDLAILAVWRRRRFR